jgi:hypothetical protein
LFKASKEGDVEAVRKLLARNVDVNETFEVRGEFGQRGRRRGRQWNGAKRQWV